MTLSPKDIQDAARAINGKIVNTLCTPSTTLSQITGAAVVLKFENLQFTGSFKERGALNKLLSLPLEKRNSGVIAMSAGNHAQAVAYHAERLGIPAVIVMPRYTPNIKAEQTRRLGAEVILEGEQLTEARACAEALAVKRDLTLVHPYDDELIMAGQGTIALEMLAERPDLEVLLIPIGGGGLISGNATAAKALRPDIQVVGVEARNYPSMRQALRGEPLTVFGDGGQSRSFCYVSDLIEGIWRLSQADCHDPVNIGNPTEFTIRQFAELVIKLTGSRSTLTTKPLPVDDPKQRRPDITRARGLLVGKPQAGPIKQLIPPPILTSVSSTF